MTPEIGKRYIFQHEVAGVDDPANGTVVEVFEVVKNSFVSLFMGGGGQDMYGVRGVETGIEGDAYAHELTPVGE